MKKEFKIIEFDLHQQHGLRQPPATQSLHSRHALKANNGNSIFSTLIGSGITSQVDHATACALKFEVWRGQATIYVTIQHFKFKILINALERCVAA